MQAHWPCHQRTEETKQREVSEGRWMRSERQMRVPSLTFTVSLRDCMVDWFVDLNDMLNGGKQKAELTNDQYGQQDGGR